MIILGRIVLVAVLATLIWKARQLAAAPRDRALLAIVVCQLAALANNVVAIPAIATAIDTWLAPGVATTLFNGLLAGFFFTLLCFYLYASHREAPHRVPIDLVGRRVWLNGLIYVAVLAALALSMVATPATFRGALQYLDADRHVPGVAMFYVIHSLYLAYATAYAVRLARSLAAAKQHIAPRTARGLQISAAGLCACLVGGPGVRLPSTVANLFGGGLSHAAELSATAVVTAGVVLFAGGIIYPLAVDGFVRTRLWVPDLYAYLGLRPLWGPLVVEFPRTELAVSPRERPGRRVSETLDCLEELGPYMPTPSSDETIAEQAGRVRDGLRRKATGLGPVADTWEPGNIVISPRRGYASDVAHLLRLARAFARLPPDRG